MPKICEWSIDLRQLVVKHHLNGDSIREITKKTYVPRSTVYCIIKKWNKTGSVVNRLGHGRKRGCEGEGENEDECDIYYFGRDTHHPFHFIHGIDTHNNPHVCFS